MNKEEKIKHLIDYLDKKEKEELKQKVKQLEEDNFKLQARSDRYKQKVKQLETNIKDSIERHKETIQDTKDFYRPLEDTIYSGSTLIELAETHIEILERGKYDS